MNQRVLAGGFVSRLIVVVSCAAIAATGATAWGQSCVVGEPATGDCTSPRQILGTPGQHVVLMDVANSVLTGSTCGLFATNRAWFEVTPTVSGPMTISTCHPNTSYDTVLEVYSGGDSGCDFMLLEQCIDDTNSTACDNGCSSLGSTVTVNAVAGRQYRFVVGALNNDIVGCALCLGVIVTIEPTCGDAPTNIGPCDAARELPSSPGTYEILQDVTDAVVLPTEPGPDPNCTSAFLFGHTVWFHLAPTVESAITFSTCHPNTSYDTVVQVFSGDLCTTGGLVARPACNDDTLDPACINGCSGIPRESRVDFVGHPGQDYWIQVGSYNDNDAGCSNLCLGAELSITDCSAPDPPVASLSAPPELGDGCACAPVTIVGSAFGQSTPIQEYRVEYRNMGSSMWTEIASGTTRVINGVLGQWDTVGLPQGYYLLRISVMNVCGETSTDTIVTFLDQGFDTLTVRYPPLPSGNVRPVVAGIGCVDGTVFESWCWHPNSTNAHFAVGYRPLNAGTFVPVDPAHPTYYATVVNDPFASWNTTAVPDGPYDVRVTAENDCGQSRSETREVVVDNTPPTAMISSIQNCDYTGGVVQIIGTANDANMGSWALQYTGGNANTWVTIAAGSVNVVNDVLGTWDTTTLPACAYALRLVATDQAVIGCGGPLRHRSEYAVTVNVGTCLNFDSDSDGDVDLIDFGAFQNEFTGPNP